LVTHPFFTHPPVGALHATQGVRAPSTHGPRACTAVAPVHRQAGAAPALRPSQLHGDRRGVKVRDRERRCARVAWIAAAVVLAQGGEGGHGARVRVRVGGGAGRGGRARGCACAWEFASCRRHACRARMHAVRKPTGCRAGAGCADGRRARTVHMMVAAGCARLWWALGHGHT
jgi:hypothetical protein